MCQNKPTQNLAKGDNSDLAILYLRVDLAAIRLEELKLSQKKFN